MTNVFTDQKTFMIAGDQTVDNYNKSQYNMYLDLIKEEVQELQDAVDQDDKVEQLDALIDILVVVVGALHSLGADAEGAWNEVIRSNMSKVDPATGKVIKREDGKVLKPATYSAPELTPFLTRG
jgi:predicted HAD superfamily Cof-like phosphohydrolase